MNISGIRPLNGFYDYNQIKPVSTEPISNPEEAVQKVQPQAEPIKVSDEEIAAAKSKQTFGAYDYAEQYKPGVPYSMKGSESDIRALDVEKAVNDMQKDVALHQYQYFVKDAMASEATASARGSENFTL